MKIEIEIPEYSEDKGITRTWEDGYEINAKILGNEFVIEANKEGLITLAKHLLALAQENIDSGFHFYYEEMHGLEDGSVSFVIEKNRRIGHLNLHFKCNSQKASTAYNIVFWLRSLTHPWFARGEE